jgi:hypothetical protein
LLCSCWLVFSFLWSVLSFFPFSFGSWVFCFLLVVLPPMTLELYDFWLYYPQWHLNYMTFQSLTFNGVYFEHT